MQQRFCLWPTVVEIMTDRGCGYDQLRLWIRVTAIINKAEISNKSVDAVIQRPLQRSPPLCSPKRRAQAMCYNASQHPRRFSQVSLETFPNFDCPEKFIYGKISAISFNSFKWHVKIRVRWKVMFLWNQRYLTLVWVLLSTSSIFFHNFSPLILNTLRCWWNSQCESHFRLPII